MNRSSSLSSLRSAVRGGSGDRAAAGRHGGIAPSTWRTARLYRRAPMLRFHEQPTHPHHVVRRRREGDVPVHQPAPAMPQFVQQPYGRRPAKDLFDEFAFALTDPIPRGARDATIVRVILRFHRDVRRQPELPDRRDKVWNVVGRVGADGPVLAPADFEQECAASRSDPSAVVTHAPCTGPQRLSSSTWVGHANTALSLSSLRYDRASGSVISRNESRYALPKPDQLWVFAPMLQYLAWQEAPT